MKNIVLTGFMASGKTETSKELAKISGFSLIDTDDMIVKKEGRTINEIFAQNGEKYFREVEKQIIKDMSETENSVISTGGGVVLFKENIENLRKNSVIFNLCVPFEIIAERIESAAASRPLMKNSSIAEIHERYIKRIPYYDNCDYKTEVTSDDTPIAVAKKIWDIYKGELL